VCACHQNEKRNEFQPMIPVQYMMPHTHSGPGMGGYGGHGNHYMNHSGRPYLLVSWFSHSSSNTVNVEDFATLLPGVLNSHLCLKNCTYWEKWHFLIENLLDAVMNFWPWKFQVTHFHV
jgi:hypothetical protein